WSSDRTGKAVNEIYAKRQSLPPFYKPPPDILPPAAIFADLNSSTTPELAGGLRFYNSNGLSDYFAPLGMCPGKNDGGGFRTTLSTARSQPVHLELCQYANATGGVSCYNRNRYMPYNHNRTCAAAAAIAAVSGHSQFISYSPQTPKPHQHSVEVTMAPPGISQAFQPFTPIHKQTKMGARQQPMFSSIAPITYSGPVHNSVPISIAANACSVADFTSAKHLINSISTSAVMPCLAATNTTECTGEEEIRVHSFATLTEASDAVTLQITNLDYSLDESSLRSFLINQLKPITPVVSLVFEGSSYAKVTVPDLYFAKQVVSNLHRKKIGHKRMLVSYTRDSSLTEANTLRCQVAGLLKDVPYYTLPMYKFRELFQSRFKTSISVLDLYKMQDICIINSDNNEDKFISLQPDLINTLETSPLMEGLQHSVPYCTVHFKKEKHKGWAEQEIEPLPNVCMKISEIQKLIYPLLKLHPGDIPVATLLHCIEQQLNVSIIANESGVNLEHLVCCVQGIHIQVNNFGIKILGWMELNKKDQVSMGGTSSSSNLSFGDRGNGSGVSYFKNCVADPLYQISREIIELIKMSPKSTMKFNRFIPAYHNHFGKQCRVADYGYTKLIELFEALCSVVQIMGDGENRQITLTHRTQIRRFNSDLLRVLRVHGKNSVLLSQLPGIFAQTLNRVFDVTDYGVCDIKDILDGLVNSNIVVLSVIEQGNDILISMPKRKQTSSELEKIGVFAGEMVELFQNALQYTIPFQKFVRSYHYHFAYQCRLSDYGFLKLTDLMDAIHGLVEMEVTTDEEKKIVLCPNVARRVFAQQCGDLIRSMTGDSKNGIKLDQVLTLHKKKYGYQMQPQILGASDMTKALAMLPYVEIQIRDQTPWLICHNEDVEFRLLCYRACMHLIQRAPFSPTPKVATVGLKYGCQLSPDFSEPLSKTQFLTEFNAKHGVQLTVSALDTMRHAIEIYGDGGIECVRLTDFTRFLMSIVGILEQRPTMYLYEIKSALECGLITTFAFGFPNLYSVLSAHEDLFTINKGPTQDRCDVSLKVNCELRPLSGDSHQHLFGSLKLPYKKHQPQRTTRIPIGDHNRPSYAQEPPPHKTRAISNEYTNTAITGLNSSFKAQVQNFQANQDHSITIVETLTPPVKCSSPSANSSLLSSFGSVPRNSSLWNSFSNKENSKNSSFQLLNSSFNSTSELNASLGAGDLTNITSCTAPFGDTSGAQTQLWHRRQAHFYHQPMQHQIKPTTTHKSSNDSKNPFDLVSYNGKSTESIYKAPKSETDKLPFWIDPIWSNRSEQPMQNILNIRLPEIKSMILSPYTISKNENMKRLFNFDNHDRKIA
ncbi:hypothetical protein KR009_000157, partial [Drosophila setifemur]